MNSPAFLWHTAGPVADVAPIAGAWQIVADPDAAHEVFRARTDDVTARPPTAAAAGSVVNLHGLWLRATGLARVETVYRDVLVAVTVIHPNGELTTTTRPDAAADSLALHASVLAAALATRVAAVQSIYAALADDGAPLAPALRTWLSARTAPQG